MASVSFPPAGSLSFLLEASVHIVEMSGYVAKVS